MWKVIKDMNGNKTEYSYDEDFLSRTYYFEKNIDLPIYEVERRKVNPHSDNGVFRITHTTTVSTTQLTTTTESVKTILSETASVKTSFGVNEEVN